MLDTPDSFTQTVSPRLKELFGVVQSAAYVAMGGVWKNGAGTNVAGEVATGAMRAASLNEAVLLATSGEAGAASARLRVAAEEPGSIASAPSAKSINVKRACRAALFAERVLRPLSCFFICKLAVVCRDLAGVCGDVIWKFSP
jgi:hypothetical protein